MGDVRAAAVEAFTRRMFTRIMAALARTLREEELSVAQVAALYLVDERRSMRIGEVAAELGRPLPSASRLVDDLVKRGLLDREEDPEDRRARVLTTSAKGREFLARAGADRVRTIFDAAEGMPKGVVTRMLSLVARKPR